MESNESEKKPPEETPKEESFEKDDSTIFVLAALMVDLHSAIILQDKQTIAVVLARTAAILKDNPGFVPRFKALQKEVLKELGMEVPEKPTKPRIILP